jgi:2-desacetyl-2-hydroxyethyl bacteriochlorophyllide A dehydrogenase
MHGIWLENQKISYRTDLTAPGLKNRDALVRVRLAGICGTDLQLVRGYYSFTGIPGHEFVGEVVEAPDKPSLVGQRVASEINVPCGACSECKTLHFNHCANRSVVGIKGRNGAFAEYVTLPIRNLHRVADSISDEMAVFTEPLAAALEILQQIHIKPSHSVLVVGAGRLGQLVAQVLQLTGCNLQVVARYPKQKELLKKRDISTIEESQLPAHTMDIIVEATGSATGFDLACRAVRPRGTIVLKSTYKGDININLANVVVNEVTIVGSRCGPFDAALNLLAQKQVNPEILIEDCYRFHQAEQAFKHASESGAMKILLTS